MATTSMTSQSPQTGAPSASGPATRPDMVAVGTIVWLSSEIMFFAGLFAMYFTIRSVAPELWEQNTEMLNVPFALANTTILVISSVWCQLGVFAAERGQPSRTGGLMEFGKWGMREWYVLTYIFGATFVAGQVLEYAELVREGVTLASDPYGSVFYMTTGFHGLHVTGGLIMFLLVIGRSFTAKRYTHSQATTAVVASYYWHFVDVVWVALFITIYVVQ